MAQATALDSLIEFARGQRDDALSRFAASVSASRALEERLALLVNYRDEYAARLAASVRTGLTLDKLRGFRLFLEKLELAIVQQQQAMCSQSEQHLQRRADWAQRESRLQGYATLRDRRRAVSALRSRRDEQRGTDEHARRSTARAAKDQ
jgi:flagellar FliJ protein